jgi:hypothetical protein
MPLLVKFSEKLGNADARHGLTGPVEIDHASLSFGNHPWESKERPSAV